MDIIKKTGGRTEYRTHQAEAAVKLIDEGNTIPFIARYRKEATGSLNDEVLRNLDERLKIPAQPGRPQEPGHCLHCGAGEADPGAGA